MGWGGVLSRIDQVAPQVSSEIHKISIYAWECLIRQKRAEGIIYLVIAIFLPCLFLLFNKYVIKKLWNLYNEGFFWGWVLYIGSFIVTGWCTLSFLYYGVMYLVSPEYYIVIDLLNRLYHISK